MLGGDVHPSDASGGGTRLRRRGGLLADRSACVGVIFGFTLAILTSVVGAAVDFARWQNARALTLAAVDAAVLAGARVLQVDGGRTAAAVAAAERYYRRKVSTRLGVVDDQITFDVVGGGTMVLAQGRATLETVILKLAGITLLPLAEFSVRDLSQAVLTKGVHAQQSLEVSLILDVSSSMGGPWLDNMKAAARDLVDILVWENNAGHSSRAALVPFADSIMVDPELYARARLHGPERVEFPLGVGVSIPWLRAGNCLAERGGADAFSDAAPDREDRRFVAVYPLSGRCRPQQPLVPLTSDKAALRAAIDGLTPGGGTAVHAGIAWAWYTLSPSWSGTFPAGSAPDSYQRLNQRSAEGVPALRKVAILVTDGESTIEYCENGLRALRPGRERMTADCPPRNGRSAMQARFVCEGMKARGIEVFALGIGLADGSESAETIRQCATSADHLYRPADGAQLRQAFRDVSLKISDIYLAR